MTIDTQLFLITGGLVICAVIAAWQAWKLGGILRANSAKFGAFVFFLLGARQVYGMIRLKANIADARARGVMIDRLTVEQWIVGVIWVYAIMIGFIVWMHWRRSDLKKLGI